MEWLARPLLCEGVVVAGPLDPARLVDADLRAVCFRMHVIFDTIEMPRCEGRLMPINLFDAIDTLESVVLHGHRGPPRLAEWSGVIREFGGYYDLAGDGPIVVDPAIYREAAARYLRAPQAGPDVAPGAPGT
jgi:hypothetical protein